MIPKLSPLKDFIFMKGDKYIFIKLCSDRVKYDSCRTPNNSNPTILQLRRDANNMP